MYPLPLTFEQESQVVREISLLHKLAKSYVSTLHTATKIWMVSRLLQTLADDCHLVVIRSPTIRNSAIRRMNLCREHIQRHDLEFIFPEECSAFRDACVAFRCALVMGLCSPFYIHD